MGKYEPLAQWLDRSPDAVVRLSLDQIELLLGFPLPESAAKYAPFWSSTVIHNEIKRIGWHAYARLNERVVEFRRAPAPVLAARASSFRPESSDAPPQRPDLVLLGCVKTKRRGNWPARDLYTSRLFIGRRDYAESLGAPWFILSAKHGLVSPTADIEDYDVSLDDAPAAKRDAWAAEVLAGLDAQVGSLEGKLIEIHAGDQYRVPKLMAGIRARGGTTIVPLFGLSFGRQLAWYAARNSGAVATPATRPLVSARATDAPKESIDARHNVPVPRLAGAVSRAFMHGEMRLHRPNAPAPTWDSMPELVAANALRASGVLAMDVRLFVTFMAAMDRARDADILWANGMRLFASSSWAFDPRECVGRSFHDLAAELRRSGVSQRHGPDSAAWRAIAESLLDADSPEPVRRAVFDGAGSAPDLLAAVRAHSNGATWYPFLSGPKISHMWVRMLAVPGGASIDRLEYLDVAVDVQVRKVTEYLGVTSTQGRSLDDARPVIQRAWKEQADDVSAPGSLAGTAAGLDPALWFLGKWGCTYCERARARIPVTDVCSGCKYEP